MDRDFAYDRFSDAPSFSDALPWAPTPIRKPDTVRPLRVALFSGNYNCVRDGANQALNRLVGHLQQHEGAVVRVYSPVTAAPAFAATGDLVPVRSLALPGRREYRLALGLPRAIRTDLRAFAPDIVHLSAPDWLGRSAQRFARTLGVPVIASLHTRFETYLDYYGLRLLRRPLVRYLDRFYGNCDHVLAPTAPIADDLRARSTDKPVSIWGRGVDRLFFNPQWRSPRTRAALGYREDEVVPLFFGRLVHEKGLARFVAVVRALQQRGHAVRPLIVGDGPARDWFGAQMPEARFTGHLSGEALGCAVACGDMLINPSVTEAFGNVNLEAMACGVPVIAADVPSAAALIAHRRTGLLVPADDVEAYVKAAELLLGSQTRRVAMGAAAAEAAARYSWHDTLSAVATAYRDCIRAHRATSVVRPIR